MKYCDQPIYTKNRKLKIELGDAERALDFLLSSKWLVFNHGKNDDGFLNFLEETVFTPNTKKNAEYELLVTPIDTKQGTKISFWIRIWDTLKNRRLFEEAMLAYYGKALPSNWEQKILLRREQLKKSLSVVNGRLTLRE